MSPCYFWFEFLYRSSNIYLNDKKFKNISYESIQLSKPLFAIQGVNGYGHPDLNLWYITYISYYCYFKNIIE